MLTFAGRILWMLNTVRYLEVETQVMDIARAPSGLDHISMLITCKVNSLSKVGFIHPPKKSF